MTTTYQTTDDDN